tara:strand:+ start:5135 stop:5518 length:384 start_codon:yes stop_codon:yes gene_type:complete
MEDSTLSLLYIGFSILLFFLMRPIYLWYFNINKITEQQEEQIELTKKNNQFLEKLYLQMGGEIKNETKLGKKINDDDIAKIQELKIKLKADEIFVKTLQNGIIEKWKSSDWDDVVELGNSNKFEKLS